MPSERTSTCTKQSLLVGGAHEFYGGGRYSRTLPPKTRGVIGSGNVWCWVTGWEQGRSASSQDEDEPQPGVVLKLAEAA